MSVAGDSRVNVSIEDGILEQGEDLRATICIIRSSVSSITAAPIGFSAVLGATDVVGITVVAIVVAADVL